MDTNISETHAASISRPEVPTDFSSVILAGYKEGGYLCPKARGRNGALSVPMGMDKKASTNLPGLPHLSICPYANNSQTPQQSEQMLEMLLVT
jgi:hypothetical protein